MAHTVVAAARIATIRAMKPVRTLFAIVRDGMRCVEVALDRALAPFGIDAADFEILLALESERWWSIVSLARTLRSKRAAVSRRIARLEARGLVAVDRQNQRRSRTALTEVGREVLSEADGPHAEVHAELVMRMGQETAARLDRFSGLPRQDARSGVVL